MRKNFIERITYKETTRYLIWYNNDESGLLIQDKQLLMFASINEAKSYAEKLEIELETEMDEYDLSRIPELIKGIEFSENCFTLIGIWNLFSDIAKSLSEQFLGDLNDWCIPGDGLVLDINQMLFYGSNIKVMKHDEYHPVFDDEDFEVCMSVFNCGLAIIDRQFALFDEK